MFRKAIVALLTSFLILSGVIAQNNGIPPRPNPPKLVNDFANFLTPDEQAQLERKLVAIDDSSSTQIAIVTLKSLDGNDINAIGPEIIKNWGIGQKDKNNGILLLIKPKMNGEKGEIAISTGYGMEAVITDAISKQIIEKIIIPAFREGRNYQALDEATNAIYSLSKGEFPANLKRKKAKKDDGFPFAAILIIFVLIVAFFGNRSGGSHHMSSGGGLPFWLLMSTMMSGRGGGSSGGFGGFSSGGGSFGGFGGGSGGGGGASGSW